MEKTKAVMALAALAQDNRLDVYRLLVRVGPEGLPAGEVASALSLAPNTLTFHFDRLRQAGLIDVRREGRLMIYSARFDVMNALLDYLSENCCAGPGDSCAPSAAPRARPARSRKTRVPA
jgi:DNA-binding transcriptional ArsR family regulator